MAYFKHGSQYFKTANTTVRYIMGSSLDTWMVARVLFNGEESKAIINTTAKTGINPGSLNMSGFILGARGDMALSSNIQVKEIILRNIIDTSGDEWKIYSYLKYHNKLNI